MWEARKQVQEKSRERKERDVPRVEEFSLLKNPRKFSLRRKKTPNLELLAWNEAKN